MGVDERNRLDVLHALERLVHYALEQGMIDWWDVDYSRNRLLGCFLLTSRPPERWRRSPCPGRRSRWKF